MQIIEQYFPGLSAEQANAFQQLLPFYREWNDKINVISRKDIDNLYLHHVLHSLAIAKIIQFKEGSAVLDLGTGGGFPGIPLALLFPDTQFTLIDGTRKKITVVQAAIEALNLKNVSARHIRAEELRESFDFVVSRAVASVDKLFLWSKPLLKDKQQHALPNGLIALKGGLVKKEVRLLGRKAYTELYPITDFFPEPYFEEKVVLYVQG